MASRNDSGINGYSFQWKIENISPGCWLKVKDAIESPTFKAYALEGTEWSLKLYPMGDAYKHFVSLFLLRKDCCGPTFIEVSFQLAFLRKDGSILTEKFENHGFRSKNSFGSQKFEFRERIFFTEREEFLPEDVLTVRCTLWKKDESLLELKHLYAQTVFKVNRRSSVWRIENFSTVKSCLRNKLKDNLIDFDLVLNEDLDKKEDIDMISLNNTIKYVSFHTSIDCEGINLKIAKYLGDLKKGAGVGKKLDINMISLDDSIKYISFNISIIDSKGKKKNLRVLKYFASDLKKGILSPSVLFPQVLMKKKSLYLPNDVLSLDFEYVYSTEIKSNDFSDCGIVSPTVAKGLDKSRGIISSTLAKELVENREKHYNLKEKSRNTPFLIEDLKSMYNDGIFSDVLLLASMQTFPAHKNILSSRSPVFRKMLIDDLKEQNCEHIDITDFEDDTVHQMLLYIYTDTLEDLKIESACKLYSAANKYEILSLKSECSSFLKDNLCPTKACDVLILAAQYQDENLKSAVQAYILEHDEVFDLLEWKHFMESNLKLAADIMYRKLKPGNIYSNGG